MGRAHYHCALDPKLQVPAVCNRASAHVHCCLYEINDLMELFENLGQIQNHGQQQEYGLHLKPEP